MTTVMPDLAEGEERAKDDTYVSPLIVDRPSHVCKRQPGVIFRAHMHARSSLSLSVA
jgi:hypothetical protein